jgi:subtilisin-like proprotein convertase family protein
VTTFVVGGLTQNVASVSLDVTLTHTFVGDVDMVLAAPGGAPALAIVSRIGVTVAGGFGDDSNYGGAYVFSDGASGTDIWTVATNVACDDTCPVTPGTYRTTAGGMAGQTNPPPLTSLSATFGGLTPAQANGTWTLTIRDAAANNSGALTAASLTLTTGGVIFAKGDFNADGMADIVFRNVADGRQNKVWYMSAKTRTGEATIVPDAASADWWIRGVDDFDADGRNDVVFWNQSTGAVEFWLMNGTTRIGSPVPLSGAEALPTNWDLSATADFNHDDAPDLVWRNFTSQKIVIWTMNGTGKAGAIVPSPDQAVDANWIIAAAADYTNDGNTDFLWYNTTSGNIVTWYMDASVMRTSGQFTTPAAAGDSNWRVATGAVDFSAGGTPGTPPAGSADILWRNATSGSQVIWHMDFASTRIAGEFTNPVANTPALDWVIVGPR